MVFGFSKDSISTLVFASDTGLDFSWILEFGFLRILAPVFLGNRSTLFNQFLIQKYPVLHGYTTALLPFFYVCIYLLRMYNAVDINEIDS